MVFSIHFVDRTFAATGKHKILKLETINAKRIREHLLHVGLAEKAASEYINFDDDSDLNFDNDLVSGF